MKTRLSLLVACVISVLPVVAQDMSLEDIVAAHIEARGGIEAISDINTLRMVGISNVIGTDVNIDIRYKTPGKYLQMVVFMGEDIKRGTDGTTTWTLNAVVDPNPVTASDEVAARIKQQADFIGPLVNPASKGVTLMYEGTEEVDGVEAHKMLAYQDDLPATTYFVHPETYMIMQRVQERAISQNGQPALIVTEYTDYREVAGTVFPYWINMTADGQPLQTVVFETITANETISNDLFVMPSPLGID